ncbi:MAG: four helix bundle protein [Flavobacteriales bacterium]|nr:four helix bundle protein [Flavobacteriales bacterium]MBK7083699.1 four helix bundle protein [Flavobacteriales bacterium]MBK7753532.1 four helix bundle protein [Flavobacteriales bacterium]MBK9077026.1 four helix bundle protein [Flavobacteriales bacterium]MBK9538447.1 four helix bundle protein [Flavobacteriales bacterium]
MRDFKKLNVWQLGMDIADQLFELFDSIPLSQAGFKIRDQATDAACSIPSNIAEGSSRRSEKEKYRYLEIALGSAFELQTRLLIVQRRKWISPGGMDKLLIAVEQEQKKVAAFMNTMER